MSPATLEIQLKAKSMLFSFQNELKFQQTNC